MPDIRHGKPIEEIEPFGGRILGSIMRKLKEDKECDPMESVAYALGSIADTMWLSYLLDKQKYEDAKKRNNGAEDDAPKFTSLAWSKSSGKPAPDGMLRTP